MDNVIQLRSPPPPAPTALSVAIDALCQHLAATETTGRPVPRADRRDRSMDPADRAWSWMVQLANGNYLAATVTYKAAAGEARAYSSQTYGHRYEQLPRRIDGQWINTAAVAKQVRADIRAAVKDPTSPLYGLKISVRSARYSMGFSITACVLKGLTPDDVWQRDQDGRRILTEQAQQIVAALRVMVDAYNSWQANSRNCQYDSDVILDVDPPERVA